MTERFEPISVPQIYIGNNIKVPKCCEGEPRMIIKSSCCPNDYSNIKDMAIVFVDDKDDLLKTKDTNEETTALTVFSFGSYNFINKTPISVPQILDPNTFISISGLSTISKKGFSNPTKTGFIKYKAHLKRAVKVDVSVSGLIQIGSSGLLFSVIKVETPSISTTEGELVDFGFTNTLTGGIMTFAGSIIFKNVKHGDYFAIVVKNDGSFSSIFVPVSVVISFVTLPKGTD